MKKIHIKENGITIITLVITIIILLILAGISIATLVGNDGLINKAKKAKSDYENAQEKELSMLDEYGNYIETGKIDDKDNEQNSSNEEIEKLQKEIETLKTIIQDNSKKYENELNLVKENVNEKQDKLTSLTGNVQVVGDYLVFSGGSLRKFGNVITLSWVICTGAKEVPAGQTILSIQEGFRPPTTLEVHAIEAHGRMSRTIYMDKKGDIKPNHVSLPANTFWMIECSYICD